MTNPESPDTLSVPTAGVGPAAGRVVSLVDGVGGDGQRLDATRPLAVLTPVGPRRPMARATRITLFEREVRERLSRAALDLIFARADLLSEGQRATKVGGDTYFGSTMLTIDLETLSHVLRDPCDVSTARRLAALMEGDTEVPERVRALADQETARIAGCLPREVRTHIAIRAQGTRVFIDVDVEAAL